MKIRSLPTKHRPTGWAPLKDAFLQPNLLVELSLYFPSSLPPSKAHAWRAPPLDDTYTLYFLSPDWSKGQSEGDLCVQHASPTDGIARLASRTLGHQYTDAVLFCTRQ